LKNKELCRIQQLLNLDGTISHYHVLFCEGMKFYEADTSGWHNGYRYNGPHKSKIRLNKLELTKVPICKFTFSNGFTRAPEPLPPNCYVKWLSVSTFYYDHPYKPIGGNLCSTITDEAKTYEVLRASPHPNIAKYLGCIVEDGMIKGLCLVKYDMTLSQRVLHDVRPFKADDYLKGIKEGLQHLHKLGIIHCDIKPENILMEGESPVISDFDCSRREGEGFGRKYGIWGWKSKYQFTMLGRDVDENGLAKLEEWLVQNSRGSQWSQQSDLAVSGQQDVLLRKSLRIAARTIEQTTEETTEETTEQTTEQARDSTLD
jgi:serine/threonine protein kinase